MIDLRQIVDTKKLAEQEVLAGDEMARLLGEIQAAKQAVVALEREYAALTEIAKQVSDFRRIIDTISAREEKRNG